MKLLKIFCKHEYEFDSNIYGDMIIYMNYNRSIWKCTKCGKYIQRKVYVDDEMKKLLLRDLKIKKIKKTTN